MKKKIIWPKWITKILYRVKCWWKIRKIRHQHGHCPNCGWEPEYSVSEGPEPEQLYRFFNERSLKTSMPYFSDGKLRVADLWICQDCGTEFVTNLNT